MGRPGAQDFVKWRGPLFQRFLLALVDQSAAVRSLAEYLLSDALASKVPPPPLRCRPTVHHLSSSVRISTCAGAGLLFRSVVAGGARSSANSWHRRGVDGVANPMKVLFTSVFRYVGNALAVPPPQKYQPLLRNV